MTTIGFVGLGHMGAPMAINLVKSGYKVKVFDLSSAAMDKLVSAGATATTSLNDITSETEIIFTMLQTGQQVKKVCNSEEGLFKHATKNTLFIDCSSIDVDTSRELHTQAKQNNFLMLDAPVSGGVTGAEAGSLTFMVGGEVDIFEQAKPILSTMGKNIIHAGSAGTGQVAKICNNMILGISMIAVSEAFTLAEKLGLEPQKLFDISSTASGQCWSMTHYNPVPGITPNAPANNDYQPGFTSQMMLKDLNLSQEAARSAGVATPLGAEAAILYTLFANQGYGELDFSAIIKLIAGDTA